MCILAVVFNTEILSLTVMMFNPVILGIGFAHPNLDITPFSAQSACAMHKSPTESAAQHAVLYLHILTASLLTLSKLERRNILALTPIWSFTWVFRQRIVACSRYVTCNTGWKWPSTNTQLGRGHGHVKGVKAFRFKFVAVIFVESRHDCTETIFDKWTDKDR